MGPTSKGGGGRGGEEGGEGKGREKQGEGKGRGSEGRVRARLPKYFGLEPALDTSIDNA